MSSLLFTVFFSFLVGVFSQSHSITLDYGEECPDWKPDTSIMWPRSFILIAINKTTQAIDKVIVFNGMDSKDNPLDFVKNKEQTFKLDDGQDVDYKKYDIRVAIYVTTKGNDKMDGIDNPIYYGYNPKFAGIIQGTPAKDMRNYPFRLQSFIWKFTNSKGQKEILFNGQGTTPICHKYDSEAWIGNHGIYLVHARKDGYPYFTNLYYWPRVGKMLT